MGSWIFWTRVDPVFRPPSFSNNQNSSKKSQVLHESIKKQPRISKERVPLTNVDDILSSLEAHEFILSALVLFPPGAVSDRWKIILAYLHEGVSNAEGIIGIPLHITHEDLMKILISFYKNEQVTTSEGITYMRKYLPMMYDKHTLERGQKVSNAFRNENGLLNPCYAYGEVENEIFLTMYMKIIKGFGIHQDGVFYDLGCGVGNLVYCAAFIANFSRCSGIEFINPLLERAEKRMIRWNKYTTEIADIAPKYTDIRINWSNSDFLEAATWLDATFIFLHWTAFSLSQRLQFADHLLYCTEGTFVISLTHAIPSTDFIVLVKDECTASWGLTEFYVQEKITKAVKRRYSSEYEMDS